MKAALEGNGINPCHFTYDQEVISILYGEIDFQPVASLLLF